MEQIKQNGRRILPRYASVSESEIPRIQEYAVPENTKKAIKLDLKIYKEWKMFTDRLPIFEQFQSMSLAITDFVNLKWYYDQTATKKIILFFFGFQNYVN